MGEDVLTQPEMTVTGDCHLPQTLLVNTADVPLCLADDLQPYDMQTYPSTQHVPDLLAKMTDTSAPVHVRSD